MKIKEKTRGQTERRIVTAMIVSKQVLARITSRWTKDLFSSRWANLVGKWCVEYYRKYGDAPNKLIESLFRKWSVKQDEDTVSLVEKFLTTISGEYERLKKEINVEYILDVATEHFNHVLIENLNKDLEASLISGSATEAFEKLAAVTKVTIEESTGSEDVFNDKEEIYSTFDRELHKPLIRYPGALGRFFLHALERGQLIGIMGADKTGKSYWAQDLAWMGFLQRHRIAYFAIGDLTKIQQKERFYERAAAWPATSPNDKWPCKIRLPVHLRPPDRLAGDKIAHVKRKAVIYKEPLEGAKASKSIREICDEFIKSKNSYFKLSSHANFSVSIDDIRDKLRIYEAQGFNPDIVVIDYPDLLVPAPIARKMDKRNQIDVDWRKMRGIAQELNCLVIAPTQPNRGAYTANLLGKEHSGEDKRKNAHSSGMFGINQTPEEKNLGIQRLNWIIKRHGFYSPKRVVYVAGCLSIAAPAMLSCFDEGSKKNRIEPVKKKRKSV